MPFQVILTPRAEADLDYFKRFEQRTIVDSVRRFLRNNADVESQHRKSYVLTLYHFGNCASENTACFMT